MATVSPAVIAGENFFNKISKKNINNFFENKLITKGVKAIK